MELGFYSNKSKKQILFLIVIALLFLQTINQQESYINSFKVNADTVTVSDMEYSTELTWKKNYIDTQETRLALHQDVEAQVDSLGNIYLAYTVYMLDVDGGTSNKFELHFQKYEAETGKWSSKQIIAEPSLDRIIGYIKMIVEDDSKVHLAWMEKDTTFTHNDSINYCYYDGESWSEIYLVKSFADGLLGEIALTKIANELQFFWTSGIMFNNVTLCMRTFSLTSKTFNDPLNITNAQPAEYVITAKVDQNDKVAIAWTGYYEGLGANKIQCLYDYKQNLQNGTPILLGEENIVNETNPSLFFDNQNSLHFIWLSRLQGSSDKALNYNKIDDGNITIEAKGLMQDNAYERPIIKVDHNTTAHILWPNGIGLAYKQVNQQGILSITDNMDKGRLIATTPTMVITETAIHIMYKTNDQHYKGIDYLRGTRASILDKYGALIIGLIVGLPVIIIGVYFTVKQVKKRKAHTPLESNE